MTPSANAVFDRKGGDGAGEGRSDPLGTRKRVETEAGAGLSYTVVREPQLLSRPRIGA